MKINFLAKNLKKFVSNLGDTFFLNNEQILIKSTAQSFAEEKLLPFANEWDLQSHFPIDVIKSSAELGFGGIYVDEKFGGSQLGRLEASLIFQSLAYGCVSTSAYISIHNMVNGMINQFGNLEQKQNFCVPLSSMDLLASYCLTEPNSGSDSKNLKTSAKEQGGDFIINGSKSFISGGSVSDLYLVFCLTGPQEISSILVPKGSEGLSFGKIEKKMGWKSQPTTMVNFDNVRVPKKNLIGERGKGFKYAMIGLNGGRVNIASCSLGGAEYVLDRSLSYVKERKQFGQTLATFQNTQFKLAEMLTKFTSSKILVRLAAKSIDENGEDKISLASMCKLEATEKCFEIVDQGLQLFGGYGYLHEYDIERVLRDLRVHRILEGTNEIMKVLIARDILKE